MIGALILRDVRRGFTGAAWLPIAFFLLIATLMPFAVGPDAPLLGRIGAGTLWIAALTAALLPIERLVEPDRADGVLDQLALHGMAEESVAAAKIIAHWLTFGPLLLIAAVPASALLAMDGAALARTEIALAIGELVKQTLGDLGGTVQMGEMAVREESRGLLLPTAIFARWSRI
jgi:heme exporter protein B